MRAGRPGVSALEGEGACAERVRKESATRLALSGLTRLVASAQRVPRCGVRPGKELGLPVESGPQVPGCVMCARPAHAGSNLGPFCSQKETEPWWARRWGGLLRPVLRAPSPGPLALHSATPGCTGRHALGGPGRGRNIPPRVPTGPGGRRQLRAPPRCPPTARPLPRSDPGRGSPVLAQVEP